MYNIKSKDNPIYVASAIQIAANKIGIDVIPTYINSKDISSKGFNPVFLVFRVEKDDKTVAYINFRTTSGYNSPQKFSSIVVKDSSYNFDAWKNHIEKYSDVISLVADVIKSIEEVIEDGSK